MTKLEKLLARFESGLSLSFLELQSILAVYGFWLDRVSGSHHIYVHPAVSRPISIQPDGKAAKRYQVKQLRAIISEFSLVMGSQ